MTQTAAPGGEIPGDKAPKDDTPAPPGKPEDTGRPKGKAPPHGIARSGEKHAGKPKGKAQLETQLADEQRRTREYEDKYKRALADYANLERRAASDIQGGINKKTDSLLRDFLDIYDDFVRARNSYHTGGAETAGLDSIIRNVEAMLKRWGVEAIKSTDHTFDPRLHEAMLTRVEPDMEEHTITQELRKGYITQGRVLRAALVEISTKGGED